MLHPLGNVPTLCVLFLNFHLILSGTRYHFLRLPRHYLLTEPVYIVFNVHFAPYARVYTLILPLFELCGYLIRTRAWHPFAFIFFSLSMRIVQVYRHYFHRHCHLERSAACVFLSLFQIKHASHFVRVGCWDFILQLTEIPFHQ